MKTLPLYLPLLLVTPALAHAALAADTATTPTNAAPTAPGTPAPTPTPAATPAADSDGGPETKITITATRNPEPVKQTASSVTVITRQQLEDRDVLDLPDAIRMAPGLSVAQSGTRGKITSVFIRGAAANQTLVLIDGVRANNPDDGAFDFGQIPIENIERIEVLRGSGSVLYGSDAIGGVINIITRQGSGPLKVSGKLEYGTFNTGKEVLQVNGAVGSTRLSLAATREDTDGSFANDDFSSNGISLRLDHDLKPGSTLTFLTRLSNSQFGVSGTEFIAPTPLQGDRQRELNSSLQWQHKDGVRTDRISLGYNQRNLRDDDSANPVFPSFSRFKDDVRSLEGGSSWVLGAHTVTLGLENRHEGSDTPYTGSVSSNTNAVYAQDEWKLGRLLLVPGVRHEDNSKYGKFDGGKLAAAFSLSSTTRIKGSYGTAFKAPTFFDIAFAPAGFTELRPDRSKNAEVGIETDFHGGGSAGATLFRNDIRDLIYFNPATQTTQNAGVVRTQGVELTAEKPLGKSTHIILSQTFTHVQGSPSVQARRPLYNTSADLVNHHGLWNFDLGVQAQGRRVDIDPQTFLPGNYTGYNRIDLTVGYKLKPGLDVYVRAQNLLDRSYQEVTGYPAPRFNFVVGLKTMSF